MVELNYKVFISGMICLTIIYISVLISGRDEALIMSLLSGFIGIATGVMLPAPKQVDKGGILKW